MTCLDDEPEVNWVRLAQRLLGEETGMDVASEAIEIDTDGRITIDTGAGVVSVFPGIGGRWVGSATGRRELYFFRETRIEALGIACRAYPDAIAEVPA